MPAKQICPHCFGKYRPQDFDRHVTRHADPTFVPAIHDPATVDELQAAGWSAAALPVPALDAGESPAQRRAEEAAIMTQQALPAGAEPVTQDQLRIRDLEQTVKELTAQVAGHQPLKTNLAHVAGCSSCRTDLEEYNAGIITKAIDGLSVEAIRSLGFEKGAFPQRFIIPGGS